MTSNETPTLPPPAEVPKLPAPRKRSWPWIVGVLLLVAAGVGVWYWSSNVASPPTTAGGDGPGGGGKGGGGRGGRGDGAARPTPVVAAAARTGSIDVYLNALGTVTPRNAV